MGTSLLFVATGLFVAPRNPIVGYLCAGFFGLCTLVFVIQLLPNSSSLRLGIDGFTITSVFRAQSVRWRDVKEFLVVHIGYNKMVAWDYAPHFRAQSSLRAVSCKVAGVEAALPDTYGMKAEELADLMNSLRREFGS